MNKWVSLSYPRSGATWVRYCARTMLGIPLNMGGHDDYKTPVAYIKMHYPPAQFPKHKIRGLILCIRDPKECLIRQYTKAIDKLDVEEAFVTGTTPLYGNIKFFHHFPGPKIRFYYEDFIESPESMVVPLAEFLGVDPQPFLDEIDIHIFKSIRSYETNIDSSMSKGRDPEYHQKKFDDDFLAEIDRQAIDLNRFWFSQYLMRYDKYNQF